MNFEKFCLLFGEENFARNLRINSDFPRRNTRPLPCYPSPLLEYPSPGQNFEIKLQNQRGGGGGNGDGGGGGPYASMWCTVHVLLDNIVISLLKRKTKLRN